MASVLVIGLGGTGVAAVKELKRMKDTLPEEERNRLFLLAIDTNRGDLKGLDLDEKVLLGADPHAVTQWKGVQEFLSEGDTKDIKTAVGAGGRRPLGRALLFHDARDVYTRVNTMLNQAAAHGANESDVRVIIIASLAGGTGSGIHLDIAYLTRRISETRPGLDMKVYGIFLLPGFFADDPIAREYVYGNAYAALLELDHYMDGRDKFRLSKRFEHGTPGTVEIDRAPYDYVFLADNINSNGQVVSADRYAQSEYLALAAYNIAIGPSADDVDAAFVNIEFPIIKGKRGHYFSAGVARLVHDGEAVKELEEQLKRAKYIEHVLGDESAELDHDPTVELISSKIDKLIDNSISILRPPQSKRDGDLNLDPCIKQVQEIERTFAGEIKYDPSQLQEPAKDFENGLAALLDDEAYPVRAKTSALQKARDSIHNQLQDEQKRIDAEKSRITSVISRLKTDLSNRQNARKRIIWGMWGLALISIIAVAIILLGSYWKEEHVLQVARSVAVYWVIGLSSISFILLFFYKLMLENSVDCTKLSQSRRSYSALVHKATKLSPLENFRDLINKHTRNLLSEESRLEEELQALTQDAPLSSAITNFSIYCKPSRDEASRGITSFEKLLSLDEKRKYCTEELYYRSAPLLSVDEGDLGRQVEIAVRVLSTPFTDSAELAMRSVASELIELEGKTITAVDGQKFKINDQIHFLKMQNPIPAFAIASIDNYYSQYAQRIADRRPLHVVGRIAYESLDPISEQEDRALKLFAYARLFGVICDCNGPIENAGADCCCTKGEHRGAVCTALPNGTTKVLGRNIAEAFDNIVIRDDLLNALQIERAELQKQIEDLVNRRRREYEQMLIDGSIVVLDSRRIAPIDDYIRKLREVANDPRLDPRVVKLVKSEIFYIRALEHELVVYKNKFKHAGVGPIYGSSIPSSEHTGQEAGDESEHPEADPDDGASSQGGQ